MKQQATRDLYTYWNGLRCERAAPERCDIDPAAISGLLGETFILEVDTARTYPVRLSGARVNALFDSEIKGRSFIDLWCAGQRSQITRLCASVSDDTVPIVAGLRAAPTGETPISLEMLLLPLRHRGKTHARILGSIAVAGSAPWLGLVPIATLNLATLRIVAASGAMRRDSQRQPSLRSNEGRMRVQPGHANFAFVTQHGHFVVHQGGR